MKALISRAITITGGIFLIAGITLFQIYITRSVHSPDYADLLRLGGLFLILVDIFRKGKPGTRLSLVGAIVAGLCTLQFFHLVWEYHNTIGYIVQEARKGYLDRTVPILAMLSFVLTGTGAFFGLIGSLLKTSENPIASPIRQTVISPRKWSIAGGLLLVASYAIYMLIPNADRAHFLGNVRVALSAIVILLGGLALILVAILNKDKPGERFSLIGAFAAGWCAIQFIRLILAQTISEYTFSTANQREYSLPMILLITICLVLGGSGIFLGLTGSIAKTPAPTESKDIRLNPRVRTPKVVIITAGVLLIVGTLLPWITVTYPPSDNPFLVSSQSNEVENGYTLFGGLLLILLGSSWEERRRKLFALLSALVSIVCGAVILYTFVGAAFTSYSARLSGGEVTYGAGLLYISPLAALLGLVGSFLKGPEDIARESDRPVFFKRWKIPGHPRKFVITGGCFLILSFAFSRLAGILDTSLYYSSSGNGFSVINGYHYTLHGAASILTLVGGLLLMFIGIWARGKPGESFSLPGVLAAGLCLALFFYVLHRYFFYLLPFLVYMIGERVLLTPLLITLYSFLGAIGACLGLIGCATEISAESTLTSADPVPG